MVTRNIKKKLINCKQDNLIKIIKKGIKDIKYADNSKPNNKKKIRYNQRG